MANAGITVTIRLDKNTGVIMRKNRKEIFWRYLKLLFDFKFMLAAVFVLMIFNSVISVLLPKMMMLIIDDALPAKNMHLLMQILTVFFIIVVVQCFCKVLLNYLSCKMSKKMVFDLKMKLMNHIFRLDGEYYSKMKIGELLTTMDSDVYIVEDISSNVLFNMISDVITAVAMLIFMIRIQFQMVLIISSVQLILIIYQVHSSKRIIEKRKKYRKTLGELSNVEEEVLTNMRQVVLLNAKDYFMEKFHIKNKGMYKTGLNVTMTATTNSAVTNFFSGITTLVTLGYGGYKVMNGSLALGALIAFNMYTQKIFTPIIRQIQSNLIIQQSIISLERIFRVLDYPIKIVNQIQRDDSTKTEMEGNVELRHLEFGYKENTKVLRDVNLILERGRSVALVGESGTGKTTIINLLYRLWDCKSGNILIDGKDIKDYPIAYLRENITIVSQEGLIFNDTILNNLTMGNAEITMDRVEDICKKACIHDFIMSLPNGYYTIVGHRGDTLSGGQKQRLCIARAFLKKSAIIILDEITSALDKDIQEKVMNNLRIELKKSTCILITHRLTLLEYVDEIYEMKDGKLQRRC